MPEFWQELFSIKKEKFIKPLVSILGVLIMALVLYLIILPIYPELEYRFFYAKQQNQNQLSLPVNTPALATTSDILSASPSASPAVQPEVSGNRVVIEKIGVNSPIIEASEERGMAALNKGAWRLPQTSTPDKGSNTVISGHRFRYLPPNNLTFYLLDKLVVGDKISVFWNDQEYHYVVSETKIVPPEAVEILNATDRPILTLFTCDPIWSQKNRLVVVAELVN